METTTNEGTKTATPAAQTPAENNAGSVTPAPASAPDNKGANNGTPPQGNGAGAEKTGKDNLPAGVKKRLWEQSEKIRNLEQKLTELSAAKPAEPQKPASEPTGEVDLLDDSKEWANRLEGKILSEAEKRIFSRLEQAETEKRIVAEAEKAQEYILSKPEFGNEESLAEIQAVIASPEVQAICRTSPQKGAEYAEYLWRKSKGLDSASVATANANAAKSGSPSPTGSVDTGKKMWTAKEVEAYLHDFKHPDYEKRKAEVLLALKERRIKD